MPQGIDKRQSLQPLGHRTDRSEESRKNKARQQEENHHHHGLLNVVRQGRNSESHANEAKRYADDKEAERQVRTREGQFEPE